VGPQIVGSRQDNGTNESYVVRENLNSILQSEQSSANARVFAARILAEMDGKIGKHQVAPSDTPTTPLASLSRDELADELGRLRELVSLGLVSGS
jgi:hypothetical protein